MPDPIEGFRYFIAVIAMFSCSVTQIYLVTGLWNTIEFVVTTQVYHIIHFL